MLLHNRKYWDDEKDIKSNTGNSESDHLHCENCFGSKCLRKSPLPRNACPFMSCPLSCGAMFHSCKATEHRELCSNEIVPCINSAYGCPQMMRRLVRGRHLATCPASVVYCTMEWNRWPVFSKERQDRVPFSQKNLHARHGQLDVALTMRDQRILYEAMKAPMRVRRSLRNRLTERFPAVPLMSSSTSYVEAVESDSSDGIMMMSPEDLEHNFISQIPADQKVLPVGLSTELFKPNLDGHDKELPLQDFGKDGNEVNPDVQPYDSALKKTADTPSTQFQSDNTNLPIVEEVKTDSDVCDSGLRATEDNLSGTTDVLSDCGIKQEIPSLDSVEHINEGTSGEVETGLLYFREERTTCPTNNQVMTKVEMNESYAIDQTAVDHKAVTTECILSFGSVLAKGIDMVCDVISGNKNEFSEKLTANSSDPYESAANSLPNLETSETTDIGTASGLPASVASSGVDSVAYAEAIKPNNERNGSDVSNSVLHEVSGRAIDAFTEDRQGNYVSITNTISCASQDNSLDTKDHETLENSLEGVKHSWNEKSASFVDSCSYSLLPEDSNISRMAMGENADQNDESHPFIFLGMDLSGCSNIALCRSLCFPQSSGSISGPGTVMVELPREYQSMVGISSVPPPSNPPPLTLQEILALDMNLESITRYQAKPRSMYTFLCAQHFRRDEYEWHFKNTHSEIHGGLNGWIEARCPLACYGCTYSVRRMNPVGATVVYNSAVDSFGVRPHSWHCEMLAQTSGKNSAEPRPENAIATSEHNSLTDSESQVEIKQTSCVRNTDRMEIRQNSEEGNGISFEETCTDATADDMECLDSPEIISASKNVKNDNAEILSTKKECSDLKYKDLEADSDLQSISSAHMDESCESCDKNILSILPFETLRHIARCLDSFSLCNLSMTSHYLREVCKSIVEDRGIVIQEWEKKRSENGFSWQVTYQRWRFSSAFTPVSCWHFEDCPSISDHLKVCPFNVLAEARSVPVRLCFMADTLSKNPEAVGLLQKMYPDFKTEHLKSTDEKLGPPCSEEHLYIKAIGENGFSEYNKVLKEFAYTHLEQFGGHHGSKTDQP